MAEKQAQPRQRAEDFLPLNDFERRLLQRLFSNPGEMPPAFWAAVASKMEIMGPHLLAEGISGIKGEEFRVVGDTAQPAFQNSWVGDPSLSFYKGADGRVCLQGQVKGGSGDLVFRLPEGYRPAIDLRFPLVDEAGTVGKLQVLTTGEVNRVIGDPAGITMTVDFRAA